MSHRTDHDHAIERLQAASKQAGQLARRLTGGEHPLNLRLDLTEVRALLERADRHLAAIQAGGNK